MLTRLSSDLPKGQRFQDLRLVCDGVGHVTEARNEVPPPRPPDIGGPVSQRFGYDDFYRLVLAEGEFRYAPSKINRYQADFAYDALHNFTSVGQRCEEVKPSGKAVPDLKMTYAWRYRFEDPVTARLSAMPMAGSRGGHTISTARAGSSFTTKRAASSPSPTTAGRLHISMMPRASA
jgi:hypothetical protein